MKRLTKPAQVHHTVFQAGLPESMVVECAQRHYEYRQVGPAFYPPGATSQQQLVRDEVVRQPPQRDRDAELRAALAAGARQSACCVAVGTPACDSARIAAPAEQGGEAADVAILSARDQAFRDAGVPAAEVARLLGTEDDGLTVAAWYAAGPCRIGFIHTDRAVVQRSIDKEHADYSQRGVSRSLWSDGPFPLYDYDTVHDLEVEVSNARRERDEALARLAPIAPDARGVEADAIRAVIDDMRVTDRETVHVAVVEGWISRLMAATDYWRTK